MVMGVHDMLGLGGTRYRFVKAIELHPDYSTDTLEYDFSLLRLEREVDFASLQDVFPACWPTKNEAPGNWV